MPKAVVGLQINCPNECEGKLVPFSPEERIAVCNKCGKLWKVVNIGLQDCGKIGPFLSRQ